MLSKKCHIYIDFVWVHIAYFQYFISLPKSEKAKLKPFKKQAIVNEESELRLSTGRL